ncbi:flagellar hook-length control protein FliK [Spirochaetota bacterium]
MIDIIKIDTAQISNDFIIKPNINNISAQHDNKFHDTLKQQIKDKDIKRNENPSTLKKSNDDNTIRTDHERTDKNNQVKKTEDNRDKNSHRTEEKKLSSEKQSKQEDIKNSKKESDDVDTKLLKSLADKFNDIDKNNVSEMLHGINKLIDFINKITDKNKEIIEIQDTLKGLKKSLSELELAQLKNIFDKTMSKIQSLMEKVDPDFDKNHVFNKILQGMKRTFKKLALSPAKKNNVKIDSNDNGKTQNTALTDNVNNEMLSKSELSEKQNNSSFDENFENKQNLNLHSLKNNSSSTRSETISKMQAQNANFKETLNKIVENAKLTVKDSKNATFSLKLFPKDLGSVNINLGLDQGVLNGKFLVETQNAKDLLMENLNQVRDQLEEAGISVGEFTVNVNDNRSMFRNEDDDSFIHQANNSNISDKSIEYDISSTSVHDGSINVII